MKERIRKQKNRKMNIFANRSQLFNFRWQCTDIISKVKKYNLCLGCGLCEAINNQDCKMQLTDDGFYAPNFKHPLNAKQNKNIRRICPGLSIHNYNANANSIWGGVTQVSNAWASDSVIRQTSSSGGVTSALAIYLLESHKVDAVLHVGVTEGNYLHNKLHISRSREEILLRNASRYAPAEVFNNIITILDENANDTFAFIGKPCDIAGLQNLLHELPHYKDRIKYFLAIFCAGMPSYNASYKAISTFGRNATPISLRYRGDGWPGYFTVKYDDGSVDRMTYNESWGKILGRELGFRCKICPDGIGLLADISSGDSWNTSNGYPDFTEADGKNFCFIRSELGLQLFKGAEDAGYIRSEKLDMNEIKNMQQYQYDRRHYVGWRIAAVQLLTGGILNFKGLGFYRTALHANFIRAFKDMLGTIIRFKKLVN